MIFGYGERTLVAKIKFTANPQGFIKRGIGVLLLITGIVIMTGFDKKIESAILDTGYTGPIKIERSFNIKPMLLSAQKAKELP